MTTWTDAFSSGNGFTLELTVTESSTDSGANTSVVSWSLKCNPPGNWTSYNLNTSGTSAPTYSVTINGVTTSGNWTYDFRSPNQDVTKTIKTGTQTVSHNSNGSKSITASASADGKLTNVGTASIGSQTFTLTDFAFAPSTPTLQSQTRGSNGTTISATYGGSSSVGSGLTYVWQWSYDNANWSGNQSNGATVSVSSTATVYVRGYAYDSEGSSGWSGSSSTAGVPTAPASISATRDARNVTVVSGSSSGSGISGYYVQYSTNGGSSWSSAVAMTSQSYTYTNLTAALTYLFRVYTTNGTGTSAYTTTATGIYVAAGGKRWTGSAWQSTATAKRWNGSAWVDVTLAKRWNGTGWVDLS